MKTLNTADWIILLFVGTIVIISGLFIYFFLNRTTSDCTESHNWKDGYCTECNIRYQFTGIDKGKYLYTCPECGDSIEMDELYNFNSNARTTSYIFDLD
jgi:hypothetical protein